MLETHQDLAAALERVENSGTWTNPRMILDAACTMAGIQPGKWIESCGKRVAIFAGFVAKAGDAQAIAANIRLCAALDKDAAKVLACGRCWMTQERLEPVKGSGAFTRAMRRRGACDIHGNTGRRQDGSLAAFDGFIPRPKA